jgi:hypothetical protein
MGIIGNSLGISKFVQKNLVHSMDLFILQSISSAKHISKFLIFNIVYPEFLRYKGYLKGINKIGYAKYLYPLPSPGAFLTLHFPSLRPNSIQALNYQSDVFLAV